MDKLHNWEKWIGTDESGKGDYFGPLVVVGVYVDTDSSEKIKEHGIVDGKRIYINQIQDMAEWLLDHYDKNISVIKYMTSEYNSIYKKLVKQKKNLNNMLAEMHIKVITELSTRTDIKNAIIDKFSYHDLISPKLPGNNYNLKLVTGGERDIAVAAASVIARYTFRKELTALSDKYKFDLPPGANDVINAGKLFVETHGIEELKNVAKLHFRTTEQILNQ
ncbi:hypothetical protein C6497_14615 [Candidatus Poribacteria bacterium]|nr:MAG: hypothetical protein C6497_14615 [Candidatus Poribacteria bacterium]